MITFLLLIGLGVFIYFAPSVLWGTSYSDLISLLQNKDAEAISKIAQSLGIIEENTKQLAIKRLLIIGGIAVGGIILIIIIAKILKKKK